MNIAIYGPYAAWSPHFETELEILQNHLDQGDEATFITCDRVLRFCEVNPKHEFLKCLYCQAKANHGLSLLSRKVKIVPLSSLIQQAAPEMRRHGPIRTEFQSYEDLYAYKVDQMDAGVAVLSSLNTYSNEPKPNPAEHKQFVTDALHACIAAYSAIDIFLQTHKIDKLYLFNGRISNLRSAVRACEKNGTHYIVHERGADLNRYDLIPDTLPHDLEYVKQNVHNVYQQAKSPEDIAKMAQLFYDERKAGTIPNWFSFTDQQKKGLLPENWEKGHNTIAIFMSTEAEFASMDDYFKFFLYKNQKEALITLLRMLHEKQFNGMVAVRFHPNSKNSPSDFSAEINQLGYPFVKAIGSNEQIDTYALIESSSKILAFGSTVGIEAAYWGKASILLGRAAYEHLNSIYTPQSYEETIALLLDPNLQPLPRDGAIAFGYFSRCFGYPFKWVKPSSTLTCTFKEKRVRPHGWMRFAHKWLPRIPALLSCIEQYEDRRSNELLMIPPQSGV